MLFFLFKKIGKLYQTNSSEFRIQEITTVPTTIIDPELRVLFVLTSEEIYVDQFSYKLISANDSNLPNSNQSNVFINVITNTPSPQSCDLGQRNNLSPMGETGLFKIPSGSQTHTIAFKNNYTQPIVFAQPLTSSEDDPAVLRIIEITQENFTVFVQEPTGSDGYNSNSQRASYVVFEQGNWKLYDGSILEVCIGGRKREIRKKETERTVWKISF